MRTIKMTNEVIGAFQGINPMMSYVGNEFSYQKKLSPNEMFYMNGYMLDIFPIITDCVVHNEETDEEVPVEYDEKKLMGHFEYEDQQANAIEDTNNHLRKVIV